MRRTSRRTCSGFLVDVKLGFYRKVKGASAKKWLYCFIKENTRFVFYWEDQIVPSTRIEVFLEKKIFINNILSGQKLIFCRNKIFFIFVLHFIFWMRGNNNFGTYKRFFEKDWKNWLIEARFNLQLYTVVRSYTKGPRETYALWIKGFHLRWKYLRFRETREILPKISLTEKTFETTACLKAKRD